MKFHHVHKKAISIERKEVKVLLLGPGLDQIGGVSNYYNVIKLHESKKVDYFTTNGSYQQNLIQSVKRLISNYIIFTAKLASEQYNIIHLNPSLDKKSFFRDAMFIIIARLFKKKIIVFFRGWQEPFEEKIKNNRLINTLFRLTYGKADTFIVLGALFKNKLLSMRVGPHKKFIIETTIADDKYLSLLNLEKKINSFKSKVIFLFLSRIIREKGIYIAIDAFHETCTRWPNKNFQLIIAGNGPELKKAQEYVQEKKIGEIIFTGNVEGRSKYQLLAEAHILLFPTYYGEGLPNCILEAMLFGMPIISRSNAAIPDWVKEGKNGFLTKSKDPLDFVQLIKKIIEGQELFLKIAYENHETAKEKFIKRSVKNRIITIYQNI